MRTEMVVDIEFEAAERKIKEFGWKKVYKDRSIKKSVYGTPGEEGTRER